MWNKTAVNNACCGNELLRGTCGVTRWDGESNESEQEKCGMGSHTRGVNCGVVE